MRALYAIPVSPFTLPTLIETRAIQARLFPAALAGQRVIDIHAPDDPQNFCMARLINHAIDRAIAEHAEWLVMLDVDAVMIHAITQWPATGFGLAFKRNMEPGEAFDPLPLEFSHSSYFLLRSDVFTKYRFDEVFKGYGYEDWHYMEILRRADIRISESNARVFHRWHPPRPYRAFSERSRLLYEKETGLTRPREQ